ncbi:hypothetical protein U5A82_00450 [Sphingobium sp. CR2-8]|nr:hypothetical protein [Sphingobium sp. CR2-8]MEC3908997.1 hypothetical protein [Sphingobium sp. CR2-8]
MFEGIIADMPGMGEIMVRHTSYAIEQAPDQRLLLFARWTM